MRYLAVTFPPTETDTEGIYASLVPSSSRRHAALYNLTLLDDGTTLELVRVEGERAVVESELQARENLLTYEIFASTAGTQYVYLHVEQDDELLGLLSHLHTHRLLIDFPISYGAQGVTVRVVGEPDLLQRAFDGLPAAVRDELEVERLVDYTPEVSDLRANLTPRQQEVMATAVEIGYYDDPRRATVADLADELGITQGTASEHLRKLEARVFRAAV